MASLAQGCCQKRRSVGGWGCCLAAHYIPHYTTRVSKLFCVLKMRVDHAGGHTFCMMYTGVCAWPVVCSTRLVGMRIRVVVHMLCHTAGSGT